SDVPPGAGKIPTAPKGSRPPGRHPKHIRPASISESNGRIESSPGGAHRISGKPEPSDHSALSPAEFFYTGKFDRFPPPAGKTCLPRVSGQFRKIKPGRSAVYENKFR